MLAVIKSSFCAVHMHFSLLDFFSSLLVRQVRTSQKLKEIMKKILYLGNTLNQGTARGKYYINRILHLFAEDIS